MSADASPTTRGSALTALPELPVLVTEASTVPSGLILVPPNKRSLGESALAKLPKAQFGFGPETAGVLGPGITLPTEPFTEIPVAYQVAGPKIVIVCVPTEGARST